VVRVRDGEAALDYLYHRGAHAEAERPALVLMDLRMPGIGGHELLLRLKSDAGLRTIPIIVFSSSALPQEVRAAYAEGANSYLRKPEERAGLQAMVQALRDFWFTAALLPGAEERP
jgi:CheY-like chemotaxis protein